jgi:signal transduction histidine kinase
MEHSGLTIILIYNFAVIIGAILLYFLLPILLNYPPNFSEIANKYSLSYLMQFILIILAVLLVDSIFYSIVLRGINKWKNISADGADQVAGIQAIRRKCLNLSYTIYIIQILIPTLFFLLVFPFVATFNVLSVLFVSKVTIMIFSVVSLTSIVSLVFSRKLFTQILLETDIGLKLEGLRIKLRNKIFLQIVPMIIASILFTSLIGYSRLIEEKGILLYKVFKAQLIDIYKKPQAVFNENQIKQLLNKVKFDNNNGSTFIVTPKKQIVTSNGKSLNKIFTIYLFDYFSKYNGHIYDATGETQGAAIKIKGVDGEYIVGIKYEVVSNKAAIYFLIGFIILFMINILILSYFSKSLAGDISLVADNLSEIAEGTDVNIEKRIPITSNDEIGDLVIAFNKIQEREKQNIETIKKDQIMLMERERLVSLGQMIGGIAHNFRSPIMSVAGYIEDLKDLVNELKESLDNPCVLRDDYMDIADDMLRDLDDMKPYCSYMSDLLSAVRGQAVQLNASTHYNFYVEEVVTRIELLVNFELKKYNCKMNVEFNADPHIQIKGEVSNLVQVLNNIIYNAIQSYPENEGGIIDFKIVCVNDHLIFSIKDYGKGIPFDIQNKLFNQMITTKGTKGTGLGLYMSYLTIKGRFNGDLYFESKENEGTTFYISIPCQEA